MSELDKYLKEGETLLWSGRPAFSQVLDAVYKPALLRRILVCAVICAVLEALYFLGLKKTGAEFQWIFVVIIALACAASPVLMVSRGRTIQKKFLYGATDRRLLLVTAEKLVDMSYGRIKAAAFRRDEAGNVSLLCGRKGVKAKPAQWRDAAMFAGTYNDEGDADCEKLALYAVSEPEKLKAALKGRLAFTDET